MGPPKNGREIRTGPKEEIVKSLKEFSKHSIAPNPQKYKEKKGQIMDLGKTKRGKETKKKGVMDPIKIKELEIGDL